MSGAQYHEHFRFDKTRQYRYRGREYEGGANNVVRLSYASPVERALLQRTYNSPGVPSALAALQTTTENGPTGKSAKTCPALPAEIFRLTRRANHLYKLAPSHPTRGGSRVVTNARWDAMDATASGAQRDRRAGVPVSEKPARGRTALPTVFAETGWIARGPARALARRARTAKSCGPGAPMLASSLAEMHPAQPDLRCIVNPRNDGGKKARSPRRARRKPLKPFAQGKPE